MRVVAKRLKWLIFHGFGEQTSFLWITLLISRLDWLQSRAHKGFHWNYL